MSSNTPPPAELESCSRSTTLRELLCYVSDIYGDRPALICPNKGILSYSMLVERVESLSRRLLVAPPKTRPSRIAIVLPNGPDMAVTLLSVACAGVAAPLNPMCTCYEFERDYQLLDADAVILGENSPSNARTAARNLSLRILELSGTFPHGPELKTIPFDPPPIHPDQPALVLLTSGTSGEAKRVPLTHRNLLTCIPQICVSLNLTSDDKVLSMWEQFHVGGLIDLLLAPLAVGSSILCTEGFDVRRFYELLEDQSPTWFQAVPATLHEIMAFARKDCRTKIPSNLRFVRSVAAALPETLLHEVEECFEIPVIQTFGMTEASPLITSTELPPETRIPDSVGRSFGTEVGVFDSEGDPLPADEIGELAIRGPNVMLGYENDPEANEKAFRHGWFFTGDLGCRDSEGNFYLKGRVRELINRGGEKISPPEVDQVFNAHPAVEQAASYSIPHPVLGEDIALAVILYPDQAVSTEDLKIYAANQLSPFKIPRHIIFTDSLPKGHTGKILRRKLSERFPPPDRPDYSPPRVPVEIKLVELWESELRVSDVGIDDDFFDLGGDSLSAVRVLDEIQQRLGIEVSFASVGRFSTIRNLMDARRNAVKDNPYSFTSPSLTELEMDTARLAVMASGMSITQTNGIVVSANQTATERVPLIWCFNGLRKEMRPWVEAMESTQPIYGLYSGGGHLADTSDVNSRLASHYLSEIQSLIPEGPIHVGGNCRGAHVAAHLAMLAHQSGREIKSTILVDFFQPLMFKMPHPYHLLIGRESGFRVYREFHWKKKGWESAFSHPPRVSWIDGGHGEYFKPSCLPDLLSSVQSILEGSPLPHKKEDRFRIAKHRVQDSLEKTICNLASIVHRDQNQT